MNHRDTVLGGDEGELRNSDFTDESGNGEVASMDFGDCRGLLRDGSAVVVGVRPFCRADFNKPYSAALHDLRDAEAAADFDELAARHEDLPFARERVENENQC